MRVIVNSESKRESGIVTDWWKPADRGKCWVCGNPSKWAYLDLGYQHPDCDRYPSPDGDVLIVGGMRRERE